MWSGRQAELPTAFNVGVSKAQVPLEHSDATRDRVAVASEPILVVQDTTEFVCNRNRPERIGTTTVVPNRREADGRFRLHTICDLLMSASLALTVDGLPLELAAARFWSRSKSEGTAASKRRINPTCVPIGGVEGMRWLANIADSTAPLGQPERLVHIGDRGDESYGLFCVDRRVGGHSHPLFGNTVDWRGWSCLMDISVGADLAGR